MVDIGPGGKNRPYGGGGGAGENEGEGEDDGCGVGHGSPVATIRISSLKNALPVLLTLH